MWGLLGPQREAVGVVRILAGVLRACEASAHSRPLSLPGLPGHHAGVAVPRGQALGGQDPPACWTGARGTSPRRLRTLQRAKGACF